MSTVHLNIRVFVGLARGAHIKMWPANWPTLGFIDNVVDLFWLPMLQHRRWATQGIRKHMVTTVQAELGSTYTLVQC